MPFNWLQIENMTMIFTMFSRLCLEMMSMKKKQNIFEIAIMWNCRLGLLWNVIYFSLRYCHSHVSVVNLAY